MKILEKTSPVTEFYFIYLTYFDDYWRAWPVACPAFWLVSDSVLVLYDLLRWHLLPYVMWPALAAMAGHVMSRCYAASDAEHLDITVGTGAW